MAAYSTTIIAPPDGLPPYGIRFLATTRDTKFVSAFDTVFQASGVHIIRTPFRAPNANAYAERWVHTLRHECLNKLLIVNQAHVRSVLSEYVAYYNSARPHQGLQQQLPSPSPSLSRAGLVLSHPVLSGLIHDYYRAA